MALLLVFVIGVLIFSYDASRQVVIKQADHTIHRIVDQIHGSLGSELNALRQRARMIRSNVALSEYTFVIVNIETESAPLEKLFQRQFGWLPIDKAVILSNTGKPLLGTDRVALINAVKERNKQHGPLDDQFYFYNGQNLELIASAPIYYRQKFLGNVILSNTLGKEWMNRLARQTQSQLFLEIDGMLVHSTLDVTVGNRRFLPDDGVARINGNDYLVRSISLPNASGRLPTLWLGIAESEFITPLEAIKNKSIVLAFVGAIGILGAGFLMLRNFSTPLRRLLLRMKDVSEGKFPDIPEHDVSDEIGYLTRQFSLLVKNLKEKQDEIEKTQKLLQQQAATDELTGLYNRRHLYELFPKLRSEADRQGKQLVVLLLDLDYFKNLNDQYGHLAGDACLKHFARILKDCCRVSDFIFRIGGEEFLVLSTGDEEGAMVLAEKIRSSTEQRPVFYGLSEITMSTSTGVASVNNDKGDTLSMALGRADNALYSAKQSGRNKVVAWDSRLKYA
ncbi:MAG: hypothetical protein BMS9Abin36_2055 [Gammaproteobacteria bacterium]|nr:MAG: hypothetical protein BMS9Abin36_2055 [Gammaproteobacteria bacterium]